MRRLIVFIVTLGCLLMPVATAAAYTPLGGACATPGASSSTACSGASTSTSDPINGPHGIIRKVSNIIATIAGIAAVIIIIVAGFEYITAAGDAQQAATARSAIIGAAIGLVIIVVAEGLVVFVLTKV